jgi:hypothetical protein
MTRPDVHFILLGVLVLNACQLFKSGIDLAISPQDVETQFENRLAAVAKDLPKTGTVHYYNCSDEVRTADRSSVPNTKKIKTLEMNVFSGMRNFYASEYVLCPTILRVKTADEPAKLCLYLSGKESAVQEYCAEQKMSILKNYGQGVYVLKPND